MYKFISNCKRVAGLYIFVLFTFIISLNLINANVAYSQGWDTQFSDALKGLNGAVYAMTRVGTNIYVGGAFTQTNNGTTLNGIGIWNTATNSWSALGSGVDGTVYALAVDPNGVLYVGGRFSSAGGTSGIYNAAKYNGIWSALGKENTYMGNGTNNTVTSIYVFDASHVYFGGGFSYVYNSRNTGEAYYQLPVHYFVMWNGSVWVPIRSGYMEGPMGSVASIVASGNKLFLGGSFTDCDGITGPVNNIVCYDISSGVWSRPGFILFH